MELTQWEKFIIENKNEWFSQSEIIDSLLFEMPKGQTKINDKFIYFNLKAITGINYFHLPGDIQSSYWFICKRWKLKSERVKKYIFEKWNFDFDFEFEQQKLPYECILYAINSSFSLNSEKETIVVEKTTEAQINEMKFLKRTNEKSYNKIMKFYEKTKPIEYAEFIEIIEKKNDNVFYKSEEMSLQAFSFRNTQKDPIDFKKYGIDPNKFYDHIYYFFEMNRF